MPLSRILQRSFTGLAEQTGTMTALDPIAARLHSAVMPLLGPDANQTVKDMLYGTWLGHPLHPVIVDLPIGFWTSSFLLDMLGLEQAADITLKLGTVSALGAAATGAAQWYDLQEMDEPRRIGAVHGLLNAAATAMFAGSWFLRGANRRSAGQMASVIGLSLATAGGLLGGDLAFRLGIGVNRDAFAEPITEWKPIVPLHDLSEGELVRIEQEGMPLVALRKGEEVLVASTNCTHVGGPLDEGTLDGTCVTCPWHGSVFDLRDGTVIHGPATTPLQTMQVRIIDGQVQIQA